MLASPLHVTSMQASYAPGPSGAASTEEAPAAAAAGTSSRPATESAPLAGVLAAKGAPLVLLGLALAIVFGAWHALLPGHGKTLMAAAMVGGGARVRQAVAVAVAVALMHSASVLALGLAVLGLERSFRPETLYPWLGTVSELAAVGVGVYLVHARWGAWRRNRVDRTSARTPRMTALCAARPASGRRKRRCTACAAKERRNHNPRCRRARPPRSGAHARRRGRARPPPRPSGPR